MASKKSSKAKIKTAVKKANSKQRKTTAEELTDQQIQARLLQYARKARPLLEAEKIAKAATTKLFETAKREGVAKKDILLTIKFDTEEGTDAIKSEVERIHRVARWTGKSRQLELFAKDKRSNAERYFDEGKIAALGDQSARAPSYLSQKDAQHWLEGHASGRGILNIKRASEFKSIADTEAAHRVQDLASKVPPTGDAYPPQPPALTADDPRTFA